MELELNYEASKYIVVKNVDRGKEKVSRIIQRGQRKIRKLKIGIYTKEIRRSK